MSLNIFIKTLSGKTLSLDLKGNDKISTIKAIIQQREGVPVDTQRILFEGKDLDNDRTIEECGVTKEAVLHLVLKKRESHTAKLSSYEQQELNVAQSASTSQWYNASAGLNDELVEHRDSDSKFDSYSNPAGSEYDLGKDGEFGEFEILIGDFVGVSLVHPMEALKKKGFTITVEKNEKQFVARLHKADVVWIISGTHPDKSVVDSSKDSSKEYYPAWKTIDKAAFVQAVQNYHRQGGALYVWGDNDPLFEHANAVLPSLLNDAKVQLVGNTPGGQVLKLDGANQKGFFGPHIITTGVVNLYEGVTICYPAHLGPLKVLATSTNNHPAICYADNEALKNDDCGRIVVDCGFTKNYISWDNAGAARYIVNACIWLLGLEHKVMMGKPVRGKNAKLYST